MEADTYESDLLGVKQDVKQQDTAQSLYLLQQAIAAMPGVDSDRVQAAIKKLCSGELQILGDEAERLACAKRIAKQIIDES